MSLLPVHPYIHGRDAPVQVKSGRPSVQPPAQADAVKVCRQCGSNLGRGVPHPCTHSAPVELQNLERMLTPRSNHHVAKQTVIDKTSQPVIYIYKKEQFMTFLWGH